MSAQIEDAAAHWVMRKGEPEWSAGDEARLAAWLDEDPAHKVAFWELEQTWTAADRLRTPRARRWPIAVGALLAASLAVIVALPHLTTETYRTETGGRQTVPLKDGSKLELDTATRLRAKQREVWLERGQAYFDIAHDPSRPFIVHAGPKTITVLGTKFSVRRDGDRVEVAVVEGRVRVDEALATRGDILLTEGSQTRLSLNSPEKVASDLAWREGMVTFDHTTLVEAAGEFNRYNRRQIVIEGADAAAMQVSGRFRADEPEAFARIMNEVFRLSVRSDVDKITISAADG